MKVAERAHRCNGHAAISHNKNIYDETKRFCPPRRDQRGSKNGSKFHDLSAALGWELMENPLLVILHVLHRVEPSLEAVCVCVCVLGEKTADDMSQEYILTFDLMRSHIPFREREDFSGDDSRASRHAGVQTLSACALIFTGYSC